MFLHEHIFKEGIYIRRLLCVVYVRIYSAALSHHLQNPLHMNLIKYHSLEGHFCCKIFRPLGPFPWQLEQHTKHTDPLPETSKTIFQRFGTKTKDRHNRKYYLWRKEIFFFFFFFFFFFLISSGVIILLCYTIDTQWYTSIYGETKIYQWPNALHLYTM